MQCHSMEAVGEHCIVCLATSHWFGTQFQCTLSVARLPHIVAPSYKVLLWKSSAFTSGVASSSALMLVPSPWFVPIACIHSLHAVGSMLWEIHQCSLQSWSPA